MSFIPRSTFNLPSRTPSWFAGHMARSLRELPTLLKDIDLVIEARDARLPLTSVNAAFDEVLRNTWGSVAGPSGTHGGGYKGKGKLVVYTKRDLAESRYEKPLQEAFRTHAHHDVLFADTRSDRDVRSILKHAVAITKASDTPELDMKILVVGMPNVGKSSLLNALRRVGVHKGKAFKTGSEPGITRKLTGTVKIHESPSIYVYDTPGVMVSYLGKGAGGAERGLKLALTAGIKASLFEPEIIADYLLWKLNLREGQGLSKDSYLSQIPLPLAFTTPTNELYELLTALAQRLGALKVGGEPDLDAAQVFFLKSFREGKFGSWTLDDLESGGSSSIPLPNEAGAQAEGNELQLQYQAQPTTPLGGSLTERVSATVKAFLESQAMEEARRAEGLPTSLTQEKKMAKAKELANRVRKAEAKQAFKGGPAGNAGQLSGRRGRDASGARLKKK